MILAVDMDGTLCKDEFPLIGEPNFPLIRDLIQLSSEGVYLILWTCRVNDRLQEAVDWCKSWGLKFDSINDNLEHNVEKYGTNPRKVFADFYIDDRNATMAEVHKARYVMMMGDVYEQG